MHFLLLLHSSVTSDSCIVGRGGIRWSEELRADLDMGQYACGAPPIDVYNTVPSVLPLLVTALFQARLVASGPRCHSQAPPRVSRMEAEEKKVWDDLRLFTVVASRLPHLVIIISGVDHGRARPGTRVPSPLSLIFLPRVQFCCS